MGEIINISDYFRTCENCVFFHPEKSFGQRCSVPGGWELDFETFNCASFKRRKKS